MREFWVIDSGLHRVEIDTHFDVSKLTITRFVRRQMITDSTIDFSCPGRPRVPLDAISE